MVTWRMPAKILAPASTRIRNNQTLILQVFPRDSGTSELVEDDGSRNDYLKGKVASTLMEIKKARDGFTLVIHPVTASFKGMAPNRKWVADIHCMKKPVFIKLNNRKIKFSYNFKDHIASAETKARSVHSETKFEVSYR